MSDNHLPLISIITSSYNQGRFIEKTIQSILTQRYTHFEHIIVDGMSSDETMTILKKYPHLKILREPDNGQAQAINKGFSMASGDILCFLNSDDTLLPGALRRVAMEINPKQNRHIIMGRCQYIDEHDIATGVEHPSYFMTHLRLLKIWQGHGIPQPAVFWTRQVMTQCGKLDENEQFVLDYDLFCRFSRHYQFHFVDYLFATYRVHAYSKTNLMNDAQRLAESIRISKRYWGSPFKLFYWRLWGSLVNFNRIKISRQMINQAKKNKKDAFFKPIFYAAVGIVIQPDILFYRLINPLIKNQAIKNNPNYRTILINQYPQLSAYLHYTHQWSDNWVGPHFITHIRTDKPAKRIRIKGQFKFVKKPFELSIMINKRFASSHFIYHNNFEIETTIPATSHANPQMKHLGINGDENLFSIDCHRGESNNLSNSFSDNFYEIEILTKDWHVMHDITRNQDFRPLSWKVIEICLPLEV